MSYSRKSLDELNVLDDFLINAIASDPEVGAPFCRTLLSVLLQKEIGQVRVIAQRSIPALSPNMRGIRMDVEVEEIDGTDQVQIEESGSADLAKSGLYSPYICNVYDIEPHLRNDVNLPKHNRFYQAKIDSRYLHSGDRDFDHLPNLYILTITNYDPFGYDYMMYTIQNRCIEVPDLDYRDGVQLIYFYTGGNKGGCKAIHSMLKYLQTSTPNNATDSATRKVHGFVSRVKTQPEVRLEYMTFEDYIYFERRDAAKEASQEARVQSILELLEDYGEVPQELKDYLNAQTNLSVLKEWHKLAAHTSDIEAFMDEIGCGTATVS